MFNSLVLDKIVTMSLIIVWMIFSCSFDVERHIFSFQLSVDTSFINTLSLRYNYFFLSFNRNYCSQGSCFLSILIGALSFAQVL